MTSDVAPASAAIEASGQAPTGAATQTLTQALTHAPTLRTDRLVLRGPRPQDFGPLAAFMADPVRSTGFGGQTPRHEAWRWFAGVIGHWNLRGYGFWTVTGTGDDTPLGIVGLWNPDGWPEPELGWVMFAEAEGRGIAHEAAIAVRDHAYGTLGWTTPTSNIVPGNARSVALALRLGAVFERSYDNISMGEEHLYRHPGPVAAA